MFSKTFAPIYSPQQQHLRVEEAGLKLKLLSVYNENKYERDLCHFFFDEVQGGIEHLA